MTFRETPDVKLKKDAEDFAEELMDADLGLDEFEGYPGGKLHKVIRWAFERQGSYQPPGAPTPAVQPGVPPAVDVYIEDGRGGGYDIEPFSSANHAGLAGIHGDDAAGAWRLRVVDWIGIDTGTLERWGLTIQLQP